MRTVTIAEAKAHLEEPIAAAGAGETVEITDDGAAVASLRAHGEVRDSAGQQDKSRIENVDWDAKLADLEARGIITRSKLSEVERAEVDRRILEPLPGKGPSGVLEALLEERREGR